MRVVLLILLLAVSPLLIDRAVNLLADAPGAKARLVPEARPIDLSYDTSASLTVGEALHLTGSVIGLGATYHLHGTLPAGLRLGADGTISGTPSRAGSYTFRIFVLGGGRKGHADLHLDIRSPLMVRLADEVVIEAGARDDTPVKAISMEGGDGRYSITVSEAPPWVEVTPDGGLRLVGDAPDEGTYALLVTVADGDGRTGGGVLPIRVVRPTQHQETDATDPLPEPIQTPWGMVPRHPGTEAPEVPSVSGAAR